MGTRPVPVGCAPFRESTGPAQGPQWRPLPPGPSTPGTPPQSWGAQQEQRGGSCRVTPFLLEIGTFPLAPIAAFGGLFLAPLFPSGQLFCNISSLSPCFWLFLSSFKPPSPAGLHLPSPLSSLSGMTGENSERGWGWGRAEAEPGYQQGRAPGAGFWEALPTSPKGPFRGQAGGAGNPLAVPQRVGALRRAAVLRQFCRAAARRGEGGSRNPKSAAASLHPSPAAVPGRDEGICSMPKPPAGE